MRWKSLSVGRYTHWRRAPACHFTLNQDMNVFYEPGVAHTLGKPAILITQRRGDIPGDIRHARHLVYSPSPSGLMKLQRALQKTLDSVVQTVWPHPSVIASHRPHNRAQRAWPPTETRSLSSLWDQGRSSRAGSAAGTFSSAARKRSRLPRSAIYSTRAQPELFG